jgi:hypothetical protein
VGAGIFGLSFLFTNYLVADVLPTVVRQNAGLFGVAFLVMAYANLGVHELSHLIAGWLVGFRFWRVQVWPITVSRTPQGLRIRVRWRENWFSGLVLMLPKDAHALRYRYIVCIVGGALGNGIVAAIAILLLQQGSLTPYTAHPLPSLLLFAAGLGAVLNGAVSLIPVRVQQRLSDGARLWMLMVPGPRGEWRAANWAIATYLLLGFRLRDLPGTLVNLLATSCGGGKDGARSKLFGYYWACETGDPVAAGTYIDEAVGLLANTDALSHTLQAERAFHLARYQHDPTTARQLYDEVDHKVCPQGLALRTQAAIYLESRQYEQSIAAADQALRTLDAGREPQSSDLPREWLLQMRIEAIALQAESNRAD